MRKYFFLPALALLTLASCGSDNDLTVDNNVPSPNEATQSQVPIAFGTYIGRSTTSRAATETKAQRGDMNNTTLETAGFGVFAYHTGNKNWTAASSATPNYMYNERVVGSGGVWTYWPVKFWPNDFNGAGGAVDTQTTGGAATGTTNNYISFFAYAPYAGKDDTSTNPDGDGSVTSGGQDNTGIIGISANNATGAPIVTYKLGATASDNVDLLWGTAATADADKIGTANSSTTKQAGTQLDGGKGLVYVDLVKPHANDKIKFIFKHALAKVGGSVQTGETGVNHGLQVQLDLSTTPLPDETYVTIKSINIVNDGTFQSDGTIVSPAADTIKINSKGTLDLSTGKWTIATTPEYQALSHSITTTGTGTPVVDQLKTNIAEPTEGVAIGAFDTFKTNLDNNAATNLGAGNRGGVLSTPQNVYQGTSSPILFIPGTTPHFKVTVNYVIRTKDSKLAAGFSVTEQTISKIVTLPAIESNKKYNLIIHLGLTDIRFTASVSDWDSATSGGGGGGTPTPITIDVHTPQNVSGS